MQPSPRRDYAISTRFCVENTLARGIFNDCRQRVTMPRPRHASVSPRPPAAFSPPVFDETKALPLRHCAQLPLCLFSRRRAHDAESPTAVSAEPAARPADDGLRLRLLITSYAALLDDMRSLRRASPSILTSGARPRRVLALKPRAIARALGHDAYMPGIDIVYRAAFFIARPVMMSCRCLRAGAVFARRAD